MNRRRTEEQPAEFQPTRWSLIVAAKGGFHAASREAVEALVRFYWGPVYWVIRRGWRKGREDAKDLTQEFFTRFLERGGPEGFEREKGRFRSFLYASVKHFLLQQKRDLSRKKRGGGKLPFSIEELEEHGAGPEAPPEEVFHDEWVATIFRRAIEELRRECGRSGREKYFAVFEAYDLCEGERPTHEDVAKGLGLTKHDVHNYLRSMRQRLREVIRAHVLETLADPGDIEEEMKLLFG